MILGEVGKTELFWNSRSFLNVDHFEFCHPIKAVCSVELIFQILTCTDVVRVQKVTPKYKRIHGCVLKISL